MENSSVLDSGRIIDSASMLLGSQPQAPGSAEATRRNQAMARRLEQLQAAMGQDDTPLEPAPGASPPTPPAASRRGFNATPLVMAAIVLALAGTALMSLTAQPEPMPNSPAATRPIPATVAVAAAPPIAGQPEISNEKQVSETLESWRSAWARRDVAAYLNAYSRDFSPADGSSRDSWVLARTKKLSAAASIDIRIDDLAIERVDERRFKASFRQDYASGSYRETARAKTLLFAREADGWKIIKEWQEAAALNK